MPDTPEDDALHVIRLEQITPQELGGLIELRVGVPRTSEHQVDAVDIAEIVIDGRRPGAWRKAALVVVDLSSQLVPHLRQSVLVVLVLDGDLHAGHTAGGGRLDPKELAELLDGALDDVGDFLFDFDYRGTGIGRGDDGVLDRELRVFQSGEALKRKPAGDEKPEGERPGDNALFDGKFGKHQLLPLSSGAPSAGS